MKTKAQLRGYHAQLQGYLNMDRTGAEITLPIGTVKALVEILGHADPTPTKPYKRWYVGDKQMDEWPLFLSTKRFIA